MKTKTRLLVLALLLMSILSKAQTIDPASEWRVNFQETWTPYEFYNNQYRDYIDGDTTINSIEYYKIYYSGYSFYGLFPGENVNYYNHVLHGFLREENNKWYTFYENIDTLLFDFTLNVNDTVRSAYSFLVGDPIIIVAIDSILIDGNYKKRFHLNDIGCEYIIEGIGATTGLFENMFFFEWYSNLVCYAKNGISVWGESTDDCDLAVNISEKDGNKSQFSIFPNPAIDFTTLRIPNGIGKMKFTLTDSMGRIVYQDYYESSALNRISLHSYPSGVYFAIIESNGMRQTAKLMIE